MFPGVIPPDPVKGGGERKKEEGSGEEGGGRNASWRLKGRSSINFYRCI